MSKHEETTHGHSQAGAVDLEAEQIEIEDTSIAGDCVFAGKILVIGDLVIAGNVRFEGDVAVANGARIVINGRTWVPKTKPKE